MRQRRQLPPHFSVQERAHALEISYKTSALYRDLMAWKRPAALITTFITKCRRKGNLYFVDILYIYVLLTKCALFS